MWIFAGIEYQNIRWFLNECYININRWYLTLFLAFLEWFKEENQKRIKNLISNFMLHVLHKQEISQFSQHRKYKEKHRKNNKQTFS